MKRVQLEDDFVDLEVSTSSNDDPLNLIGSPMFGSKSETWAFDTLLLNRTESIPIKDDGSEDMFHIPEDTEPHMPDLDQEDDLVLAAKEDNSGGPPRFALDDESQGDSLNAYLSVAQQPPREVRTRKKKEKRPFSVKVLVKSLPRGTPKVKMSCRLVFADDHVAVPKEPECSQTLEVSGENIVVAFTGLGIINPCLKWKDREFALEISLAGVPESRIYTRRLYSYSNLGVLQRRRDVQVAGLSARMGSVLGGMRMHLVGKPFFKSDRLKVVFRILCQRSQKWVGLDATNLEYYSDSVLFFDTPRIPLSIAAETSMAARVGDIKAYIQVTNDGTNFSKGIEFVFCPASNTSPTLASTMRAKRPRNDDELQQARL